MKSKSHKRTYVVVGQDEQRLVIASNKSQAIHHVVSKKYHAVAADGMMVAGLMDVGVKVEYASSVTESETQDMFKEEKTA